MPNLTLADIHDIGGWCFAALILGALVYCFVKGLVVARAIYDDARQQVIRGEAREQVFLTTIQELTAGVRVLVDAAEKSKDM